MARKPGNAKAPLKVEVLTHDEATRKNIPTAEYQSVMQKNEQAPVRVAYERRNRDLDPQLVWRGKDEQDWSDLGRNDCGSNEQWDWCRGCCVSGEGSTGTSAWKMWRE